MTRGVLHHLGEGLRAAADLVLPGQCAGCGEPAPSPLCTACRAEVRAAAVSGCSRSSGGSGPGAVPGGSAVQLHGAGGVPCWSAVQLEGAVRVAVTAYKDGGRRDVVTVLAPLLAGAVGRACREDPVLRRVLARDGPVLVVAVPPAPRARRRRGDDPVGVLVAHAVRCLDDEALVHAPVLRHTRRVADQAGLGRDARAANLAGALAVLPRARRAVREGVCIVVDDVLTTGATVAEAARALRFAGAAHVAAATLAVRARQVTPGPLVGHREGG